MTTTSPFLGLTMPVFTAFGWAGEAQAVEFALDQLKQFSQGLHEQMPREGQLLMPHSGLDTESQCAYLANSLETSKDMYITYHCSPFAFRKALSLLARPALDRAFKTIQANPKDWMKIVTELGDGWEIRMQQMEFDPETEQATHYKDLFKDKASKLTAEESAELIDRMLYLNGEEKWLAPIYFTKSFSSEFVAAMNTSVTTEMAKEIELIVPLLRMLAGGIRRQAAPKKAPKKRAPKKQKKSTSASALSEAQVDEFTYTSQLKPMHIRKGFVNLTPAHWPFFSLNSRTVVRPIILHYDGHVDEESTMWRLVPDDTARLMLSDKATRWMSDNCQSNDKVQITARKAEEKVIVIDLERVT